MSGSSSSSSAAATNYEVFLSFRGKDTRNNFTDHLHAALCRKDIKTFIDYEIDRGDDISHELYKGIEESMIYVIIFSENYASSSWCLKELVKILECKMRYGRHVIPIFYKVEAGTVKYQEGSYEKAFADHINQKWFAEEEIESWKVALKDAGGLKGTGVFDNSPETKVLDSLVEDILKKLDRSISSDSDNKGMVGIDEHIAQIKTLLQLESKAVRIIGIWGMGGIGKTTLARALYDKLGNQFRSRSLVENAQKEIDRDGTRRVRQKYLSELGFSDERLKQAKVLLILDDVKNSSKIQELIGGHGNFGLGSRIIVTSRDLQVLKNAKAAVYEVKKMNFQDSQKLFSLYAFKQIYPVVGFGDLVEKILEYAKGVPLALQVVGSLLYDKKEDVWESALEKLKQLQHVDIFDVLKLSYEDLDRLQKDIFLDIACFYAHLSVNEVVELLDSCGFKAKSEMAVLKDRCLISIFEDKVVVHDLILEMGKEIVRNQCAIDPSGRSRLWNQNEIREFLKRTEGNAAIHCIFLNISQIKKLKVHQNLFNSMHNLRMLNFHKHYSLPNILNSEPHFIISDVLESLPHSLKVLHWDEFPQRSLSVNFCPENLVELRMRHSHLVEFWENDQELPNLKRLDLSNSWNLIRIPDLSKSPNIEEIILSSCESLTSLPIDLCKLKSLRRLDLNCCKKLEKFPEIKETMENLAVLVLDQTAIQELPSSLNHLAGLEELSLEFCSKLEIIQNDIGSLLSLRKLSLQGTGIMILPESIAHLSSLESLDVSDCKHLVCIPQLPPFLKELLAFDCPSITSVVPNPSDSKKGTFKFHLTNNDEPDPSAQGHGDIGADARFRITADAYRFVYYCFPGSAVPNWFSYRGKGNSVTVVKDPLNLCNDNRLIGFAMCVILEKDIKFNDVRCRLKFESDGRTYILLDDDQLNSSFSSSGRRMGHTVRDHTFLWKYHLMDSTSTDKGIFHADKFTFEIEFTYKSMSSYQEFLKVKECGICPLYSSLQRVSNNDVEEHSGKRHCLRWNWFE